MAKYSFELKKKLCLAYLNGEGGYGYLKNKYDIPAQRLVETWFIIIKHSEMMDLCVLVNDKFNSFEKKRSVVELYLASEISYQALALQEGISNPCMIANWVNRFRAAGPDALKPHKKGRKKTLINQ